ncbi:MAG TPA: TetR/AcrR family transcriptional regulator [Caulobacteraceae bacterium]|nr:TetR/AcrR family transcriptional regulator [Caulobacteraceae bacterium]
MPRILSQDDVSEFRERLCAVAERLFAEHGAQAVGMRQLAAELGVSPMTAYRYFKDKDDILSTVRASSFDRFSDALEAALRTSTDAVEQAAAVGDAYFNFALNQSSAYKLMFDLDQPNEADYPDLVRATARAKRTMSDYIRGLLRAGVIEGDVELMAHVFWAAIHGLVVLHMAGKLPGPPDVEAVRDEMFRALFLAYLPRKR